MNVRSLYVCYFGLREPLVQSQVLPYLRELTRGGAKVWLLTFEPLMRKRWNAAAIEEWRERLRADGIEWSMTAYHARPSLPAKLLDIVAGTLRAASIVRRNAIGVVHARSHVAAAIGALVRRITGAALIFDIRGLLADEYVDAGRWRAGGVLTRLTRRAESSLLRSADAFVVLTKRFRDEQFAGERRPLAVIPCCVDPARFASAAGRREEIRKQLGAGERTVIVYIGALGGTYSPGEMAQLFAAARRRDPRVFPLVLTQSDPALITGHLATAGLAPADYHIATVAPEDVPAWLAASDIGISIISPGSSRRAASPTKFAEYLASGLPVICSRGVGDQDAQIEQHRIGVLLDGMDEASFLGAFDRVQALRADPELRGRCLALVRREYDLETVGGVRYRALYEAISPSLPAS